MVVLFVVGKMDVGKKVYELNFDERFLFFLNIIKKGKKWWEFGERRVDRKLWGYNNGYEC